MKEKFMIVGGGGRESAFAKNLAQDTELYAVISHKNPSIIEQVNASGGRYIISDPCNPQTVTDFAKKNHIDYVFVSADGPLEAGVIDALLEKNIKAVGGTKAATRIEWDKIYSINLTQKVCPEYTPFYRVICNTKDLTTALNEFKQRDLEVVVKPQGLTGGKGVKVMPIHLPTYQDAQDYAQLLLDQQPTEQVLLVEKLNGIEFTIMGLTDGKNLVMAPATYDYPFRLENDLGAGTGGMGCFTDRQKKLPFMTEQHWIDCQHIMQTVIDEMRVQNLSFNGILNAGFFITQSGVRFMEFNGRFGDPEALNILSIMNSPLSKLIKDIYHNTLSNHSVSFINKASVVKYLVAKEYPQPSPNAIDFTINISAIEKCKLNIFFSSAIQQSGDLYQTLKTSRVLAIAATADSITEASQKIDSAIEQHINALLEYRSDIGSKENLAQLKIIK